MTSDKDLTLHFFYSSTNWCMLSTTIISLLGFPRPVESSSVFKVVLGQIAKFEQVESHRYEAIWVCRPSEHILHPESTRNPGRWSVAGGWSGRIGSATWLASQNWLGGFHWLAKALQWDLLFQSIVIGLSGRLPSFIMNYEPSRAIQHFASWASPLRINCSRSCWKHDPGDMAQGRRSSLFWHFFVR